MRILILGSRGQVGWELRRSLQPLGTVIVDSGRSSDGSREVDFLRPETVTRLIAREAPDVIVNAAAYTAVDKAEQEPWLAKAVNADAVNEIAKIVKDVGALLVHFSTDYVYDGHGDFPREEDSAVAPLSCYGRTKLEGEINIRLSGCDHLIFRTSWVYASFGHNFLKTIVRLANDREELSVVDDQIGAPTGAEFLADATAHAVRQLFKEGKKSRGTYHCVASGETSWYEYAKFILRLMRHEGAPLKLAEDALRAISSLDFGAPAKRPLNSRLSTRRLTEDFGIVPPAWEVGVRRVVEEVLRRGV